MLKNYFFIFIFWALLPDGNAQEQIGFASVRPEAHEGMMTQSNTPFSHDSLVASHRSIPLGKIVKVTNLKNLKYVVVKINDRGPFVKNRILDLSEQAAFSLNLKQNEITEVRVEVLEDETPITPLSEVNQNQYPFEESKDITSTETQTERLVANDNTVSESNKNPTPKPTSGVEKEVVETRVEKDFSIQVGSFDNKDNAYSYSKSLSNKYNIQNIKVKNEKKDNTFKVLVGQFTEFQKAQDYKNQLVTKFDVFDENSIFVIGKPKENADKISAENELDSSANTEKNETNTSNLAESTDVMPTQNLEKKEEVLLPQSNKTLTQEKKKELFTVQVGNFSNRENAHAFSKELSETYKIYNIKVKAFNKTNSTEYKVVVGRFTERQYAQAYKEQLKDKVENAFVITLEN